MMTMLLLKILAISLAWTLVQGDDQMQKFLYKSSGENDETLVVVTFMENDDGMSTECRILKDQAQIDRELQSSTDSTVEILPEVEMRNLIEDCEQDRSQRSRRQTNEDEIADEESQNEMGAGTEAEGYDGWNIIFPGTKWCGAGDIAKNYSDLGHHQDTDRCCRAHDYCNDTLAPGESRKNLTNKSPFTKLCCQCDNDFYDCLDRVNSVVSNIIGHKYFNLLRRRCYEEDYPEKCKTKFLFKYSCESDKSAPKEYQWKPAKRYKKIPIPGPLTITLPF